MNIYVFAIILGFLPFSYSDTKVWLYSSDINDPQNWESGKTQKDCNGLIFAEINTAYINIDEIEVKSLTLPRSGVLVFHPDSKILLNEQSQGDLNCVKLKPLNERTWWDFSGWNNTDDPDNPAIPYNERPPSRYDDIVFPRGRHSGVMLWGASARSITIGQGKNRIKLLRSYYDGQISDLLATEESLPLMTTRITNSSCQDVTGCATGLNYFWSSSYCHSFIPKEDLVIKCENPIKPIGFCDTPKCGATVIIENFKPGFTLVRINEKLKEYRSYTHASKTSDASRIQIVFMEKEFSGSSLLEATEFYDLLRNDGSFYCGDVTLHTSGPPLYQHSMVAKNAMSLLLGTLLVAILIFSLLFLLNSPFVRNRLLGNRPLSTYILRYDNIEDKGYIIDGRSVAGSVTKLNRSFENPMYEHMSSASTSKETLVSLKLEGQEDTSAKSIIDADVNVEEAQEMNGMDVVKEVGESGEEMALKQL